MLQKRILWLAALWLTGFAPLLHASTLVFDKTPLPLVLPVAQETLLVFDESVTFNSPAPNEALTADKLSVHALNDTVYLTAQKPFTALRIYVHLQSSNQVIPLDISARARSKLDSPVRITTASNTTTLDAPSSSPYVTLLRFGIQQLYAPKRLLASSPDIRRVPMNTTRTVPLFAHTPQLIAMPLISWQMDHYTLTAISLVNQGEHAITLSESQICGDFLTAAFFPRRTLAPAQKTDDRTTLWVIAHQPFATTMEDCYGHTL